MRALLLFAAFCRAVLLIFRWFINYLGLWQSWGQGFEPPQLHQFFTRGYGAIRDSARAFDDPLVTRGLRRVRARSAPGEVGAGEATGAPASDGSLVIGSLEKGAGQ